MVTYELEPSLLKETQNLKIGIEKYFKIFFKEIHISMQSKYVKAESQGSDI